MDKTSTSIFDVSIIVPVYNAEKYLETCLQSLIHQTLESIEIICINDGSTDRSASIIEQFAEKDKRIKYLSQANSGVSRARNVGLEMAQGDFLLFVDSDDYISLTTCQTLLAIAKRDHADIVSFGGKTFPTTHWADASFAHRDYTYTSGKSVEALLFEAGSIPLMCNKFYSRKLLEKAKARFNENLSLGEDNAFQFCVFPHANIVSFIKDTLYFYRGHDDSAVGTFETNLDKKVEKHFAVIKYVVSVWKKEGFLVEHGKGLLEWSIGFLYNDMIQASFNVRLAISRQMEELLNDFSRDIVDSLNDDIWARLNTLLQVNKALDQKPLVSFILPVGKNGYYSEDSFRSIANQTEQRIEILIKESKNDIIRSWVQNDSRCRFFSEISPEQVIQLCRSENIIFASSNSRYEPSAVAQLMDHLDVLGKIETYGAGGAPVFPRGVYQRGSDTLCYDVVTFTDSSAFIRTEDTFFKFAPPSDKPLDPYGIFSFNEISERGFCVYSLFACNKLFSKKFLLDKIGHSLKASEDLSCRIAVLIEFAKRIIMYRIPLVAYSELKPVSAHSDHNEQQYEDTEHNLSFLLEHYNNLDQNLRRGYDTALAEYCLAIADAFFSYEQFNILYPTLQKTARIIDQRHEDPLIFSEHSDSIQFSCLLKNDAQTFFSKKMTTNLQKMLRTNAASLKELGELHGANARLVSDIDEFYKSISYRVGRTITWLPRQFAYKLKSIRNGAK